MNTTYRSLGRHCALLAFAAGLLLAIAASAAQWQYPAPGRIVAFADVHGAYEELTTLLREAGIVDEQLHWSGGEAHLVSLGDLLDRGARSRDVLELLMRLEQEAAAAGGAVHVVLGNHELMNLTGELGYVSAAEYAAFAADENAALRDAAFERYSAGMAEADRAAFETRFPPGYFAHRAAFSPTGRYGRWLLEQPVLLQLGDTVFVHGGLPALVGELGGAEVNERLGADIQGYSSLLDALLGEGGIRPGTPFREHVAAARAAGVAAERVAALERLAASPAFDTSGPLWYRGSSLCYPASETAILEQALQRLAAERLVVGHTPTVDRRVTSRFDGRVVMLDTGMLRSAYAGRPAALVIEGETLRVRYAGESELAAPVAEPRRVGSRPGGMDDDALEEFLRTAAIVSIEDVGTGVTEPRRVYLAKDGVEVSAVFKDVETDVGGGRASRARDRRLTNISDRWQYELAAYRLDRLLDLRMVPVTVERQIDGKTGSLQFWIENAMNMKQRLEQDIREQGWCPLSDQYDLMLVFDVLIYNSDRTQENVLYTIDDWMVRLIDHSRAFRTLRGLPPDIDDDKLNVNPEMARRLAALEEAEVREAVGAYLDRRQISALLERRDALLKRAARKK